MGAWWGFLLPGYFGVTTRHAAEHGARAVVTQTLCRGPGTPATKVSSALADGGDREPGAEHPVVRVVCPPRSVGGGLAYGSAPPRPRSE